jgi:ribosomal protein S18 acetylase RimI-like enzyme
MSSPTVRELREDELRAAAALLGRGMRDNPLHLRAFGADPDRREAALTRFFRPVLRQHFANAAILGGFQGGELVGVCSMAPPGRCQPSILEKIRIVPAVVRGNPLSTVRAVLAWTGSWARRDPPEPHWHLGPVAVERRLQRQGIGGALLRAFCDAMDRGRFVAWLETDKRENVGFYERYGFVTAAEEPVLGVPNWFMLRRPAPERPAA